MFAFLILAGFAIPFFGIALVLGTEPRMLLERTERHVFRVTGSNHFAGRQFYTKSIEGVERVDLKNAYRNRREDSMRERQRQMERLRLDFTGANGAVLSWDREEDRRMIDDFMRGDAPSLALTAPPPWWRQGLTWFSLALGVLIFFRAIQSFFSRKEGPTPWS